MTGCNLGTSNIIEEMFVKYQIFKSLSHTYDNLSITFFLLCTSSHEEYPDVNLCGLKDELSFNILASIINTDNHKCW